MTVYAAPSGDAVNFVFDDPGYVVPLGDVVNFVFSSGYEEFCEDGFVLDKTLIELPFLFNSAFDTFQMVDNSILSLNIFSFIPDLFSAFELASSYLIADDYIISNLSLPENLIVYIPTGIIQMISKPFVLTEIVGTSINLTEFLFSINLTEIDFIKLDIVELIEAVTIIEVI